MAKIIAYDEEARQGMLAGLDKLANTVKVLTYLNISCLLMVLVKVCQIRLFVQPIQVT